MTRKIGALIIPDLLIAVPLYEGDDAQEIVDAPSSAVRFRLGVQDCIADHCHQEGFSRLNEAVPGKTVAWVVTEDDMTEYSCTRSQIGRLVEIDGGHYLRDAAGAPVYKQNEGGLCIYTCAGKTEAEITHVRLTYWQPERILQGKTGAPAPENH